MKSLRKLALFLPLLFLTSCGGPKEAYAGRIVYPSSSLKATTTKYDYVQGDTLDVKTFTVTFDGTNVEYEGETANPKPGVWFITKSNTTPSAMRVKQENLKLSISENKKDETFYIGYLESIDGKLHVSDSITIHITNSQAMKTWVYWVVGSIVVVGTAALVYFSRKYKQEHPNK